MHKPAQASFQSIQPEHTLLKLPQLCGLWNRARLDIQGKLNPAEKQEHWQQDLWLMGMLGIGLEETVRFLYSGQPSFDAFERWIIAKNNGLSEAHLSKIREEKQIFALAAAIPDTLTEADLAFWEENGYVVVQQAVSREQCREAELAVWKFLGRDPENPATWYQLHEEHKGIMVQLYQHPALDANRSSVKIRRAYEQLYGTNELWVNTDRTGFNPPETEQYKFQGTPLHWDVSLVPPIPFKLQGLLYLNDVSAEQGAFSCVPGFHRCFESWLSKIPAGEDPRKVALLELTPVPIAGKAGDFIIWHQALPHAASSNRGNYPRLVQYFTWQTRQKQGSREWR